MRLTQNDYSRRTKPFDGKNPFDASRVGVSYYDRLLEDPVPVVKSAQERKTESQETTVYNALAAYPRYADKYGRNDAWFELKYNFHLTNDELIWIINRALKKGWINEYGKEAALRILGINSIEESYQVLDELNPKLWQQDGTLRPEVHDKLIEIQDEFIKELNENNIPVAVLDAWLVGSNASYNYTDQSDLDLHIIVDSNASSCDAAVLQILYNYFKSNFNSKYDISIHGIDVELYIEDVNSNAVSNGIYSLKQDKWIKKPIKADIPEVQLDSELLQKWTDKYNNVVAGVSAQTAQSLVNELYLLRKQSLATEGEYGQGNLIFKEFRNNGYLDKLKEIAAGDKSKELSLESRKLRGDVSMKNTLYEAIINNASREIRCYDRTTGEELCFNLEEGVKDGYTLFIKALAEKLNYEGDEFNSTVNLWEFCNNNTDVLEKMFENATTVHECYNDLVQFINEGVSIKEGARLAKCLSSSNIITESLKEEKAPSYSTELMQKLTDLPEGSIIEIRNTEGTVDKAFRKVSTAAGIWVCTKEGTAESAYTTDLATDYKDDGWMIDYVQAEGLHRTAIKSVGTKNIKESLYFTLDFDDINNIVSSVVDEVKKKDCVVTADAEYNSDVSTIMLFVTLKNGEEHTNTVNLEKLDTPEQLRRSLKNKFELMTDVCEKQSNKLAEAPNEKKEVFVYKAMDINGNGVFKVFYDDGTYEILKGSRAYERSMGDYDKFVSIETLRHATAPPKSATRQSRKRENVSIKENISGDASKLVDVLSIAKKIGIETVQELMDFQERYKGQDLLVALKDYEKEFDAAGEELDENIFTKRKERKKLYKEISNIDDIIPTDADNISDDKPNKADSRYKMKVREGTEQKSLYYVSYKANNVYQAILAKASSEQEAKDKVQKKMPDAKILGVRVAYAGDKKPGMPVVEDAKFYYDVVIFNDDAENLGVYKLRYTSRLQAYSRFEDSLNEPGVEKSVLLRVLPNGCQIVTSSKDIDDDTLSDLEDLGYDVITEASNTRSNKQIDEASDTFGIPTDDELDAEYQKKKELIAKKRILAQSKYDSIASLKVEKIVNKKTSGFINDQAIMKGFSDLAKSYGLTANMTHNNYIRFYYDNIIIESEESSKNDTFSPGYNIHAGVGLMVYHGTLRIESYIKLQSISDTKYVIDELEEVSKESTVSELLKLIKSKVERVSKKFSEIKNTVVSTSDNSTPNSKQYSYNSRDRFFQIVSLIINTHKVNEGLHNIVEQSANTYEVVYQPYDRYDTLAVKHKKFTSEDDYQALRYVVKTIYGYDDEDIEDMELTSEDAIRDYLENVDASGDAIVYHVVNKTLNKAVFQSSFDYDDEDDINDTDTNREQDTNDIISQSPLYNTLNTDQTKFDSGSSKVVNVIRDTGKNFGYDNAHVFDLNISLFQEQVSLVPDTNYRRNNVGAAYNEDLVKIYTATSGIVYRDKQFYAYFTAKYHYSGNSVILFDIELPVGVLVSIDNTIQAISSKDVSKQFIADLQEYAKSMCTGIVGNSVFEFSAPADIENVDKYAHELAYKYKRGSNK